MEGNVSLLQISECSRKQLNQICFDLSTIQNQIQNISGYMRKHIQSKHPEELKRMERKRKQESRKRRTPDQRLNEIETKRQQMKKKRSNRSKTEKQKDKNTARTGMMKMREKREMTAYTGPDFSQVPKRAFNKKYGYVTSNPDWKNHSAQWQATFFCYCWKYAGNKTLYCT